MSGPLGWAGLLGRGATPAKVSARLVRGMGVQLLAACWRSRRTTAAACAATAATRAEGEKLSRRNGELEAATRRVRGQLRDAEADK